MRVPVWLIVLSIVDCVAFIAVWAWRATDRAYQIAVPWFINPLYQVTADIGLVIGIYGFIKLGRLLHDAQADGLQPAILCVLFALVPGCAAIVVLLTFIGGQPV